MVTAVYDATKPEVLAQMKHGLGDRAMTALLRRCASSPSLVRFVGALV